MRSFVWILPVATLLGVAATAGAGSVVARVNGTGITAAEVQDMAQHVAQSAQGADAPSAEAARENALESLIEMEVLAQQAKAEKITPPAAEVDQQLAEIKAHFPDPAAFQKSLKDNHITEAELRREIGRGLTIAKLIERHVIVKLPESAAEEFYRQHPDKFQHPGQVRASHILFRAATGADAAAAKQRATAALERLHKGEDFGTLARELSEDPATAPNQGDLGFFPREGVVKPFADAAFSLQPGQVSDLVRTEYGFHIIKVVEIRPAGITPLDDVRPRLQRYLEDQEREKQQHAFIEELKKKAKIEIIEPKKSGGPSSR